MSIEAMKQALEALANSRDYIYLSSTDDCTWSEHEQLSELKQAITALRQAIEQAEQYNATSDHCLMENEQGDLERIKLVQTGVGIGKPEQEPVAWQVMVEDEAMKEFPIKDMAHDWCVHQKLSGSSYSYWIRPLYTSPPVASNDTSQHRVDETAKQRHEPLTDEEIEFIYADTGYNDIQMFARAIEAAHGIKREA